jgi:nitrite reductase/ring-hydroxylating ferredoxin subunit
VSATPVARVEDIPSDHPILVEVDGVKLALVRVGEAVYAIDDTCTHQGGPLSGGKVYGTKLACPWHGWSYDVRTGTCLFPPRGGAVSCYPVRVEAGDVFVEVAG